MAAVQQVRRARGDYCSGGADAVYRQLRKSFRVVSQQQAVWQEASDRSSSLLQSLANHAEQLQCSRRAFKDGHADVLTQFPDVQSRLEFKLKCSMEVILAKLHPHMQTMKEVCRKHTQHSTYSLNVYHNKYREVGVAAASARTATWPSIADMLQWLVDIDGLYRRLYAERRWFLDTVSYDNLDELQSLPSCWRKNDNKLTEVQNVLAHVAFFMADG